MRLHEYALKLLETTGSSFVVGSSASMVKNVLKTRKLTNRSVIDQPLRNGGEFAKYAMLYSTLYYGLSKANVTGWARSLGSSFATSFACGLHNGGIFGLRSGIGGIGNTLVHDIISEIKRR